MVPLLVSRFEPDHNSLEQGPGIIPALRAENYNVRRRSANSERATMHRSFSFLSAMLAAAVLQLAPAAADDAADCAKARGDAAIAACTRLIRSTAGNPQRLAAACRNRRRRPLLQGRLRSRGGRLRPGNPHQPEDARAHKDRGLSLYQQSKYDAAIADLNAAIAIDPNFARAYQVRGDAYYYKGDYDRAAADYGQEIRINPKDARAHKDRGLSLYQQSKYDAAIADLNAAIAIDPQLCAGLSGSRRRLLLQGRLRPRRPPTTVRKSASIRRTRAPTRTAG